MPGLPEEFSAICESRALRLFAFPTHLSAIWTSMYHQSGIPDSTCCPAVTVFVVFKVLLLRPMIQMGTGSPSEPAQEKKDA
jgi:hypothetical protein